MAMANLPANTGKRVVAAATARLDALERDDGNRRS
jgi:hypothetical protein